VEILTEKMIDGIESDDNNTEKIAVETEVIPEKIPNKRREKGERGPDKSKRRFNPNSLKNLKQFQNNSEQKSENSSNLLWIFVGLITVLIIVLIWRIIDWWKEKDSE